MNRRKFFGAFGGSAAAVAAAVVLPKMADASTGDDFTHKGYRVKWGGWRQPPAQNIDIGFWQAKHATRDLQWVSTTTGQCYPSRDWEVIDTTHAKDWPLLTSFSSEAERWVAKTRALKALLKELV